MLSTARQEEWAQQHEGGLQALSKRSLRDQHVSGQWRVEVRWDRKSREEGREG